MSSAAANGLPPVLSFLTSCHHHYFLCMDHGPYYYRSNYCHLMQWLLSLPPSSLFSITASKQSMCSSCGRCSCYCCRCYWMRFTCISNDLFPVCLPRKLHSGVEAWEQQNTKTVEPRSKAHSIAKPFDSPTVIFQELSPFDCLYISLSMVCYNSLFLSYFSCAFHVAFSYSIRFYLTQFHCIGWSSTCVLWLVSLVWPLAYGGDHFLFYPRYP